MISGLQHFRFCRRQWALIHIEQQWAENVRTVEGNFLHERAHNEQLRESRGDLLIVRGLRVQSLTLGLTGQCDVVEFRRDDAHGVPLAGKHGLWLPYPVEYKRGAPKQDSCDELQLCAQAMCLEEMFQTQIPEGAIYYITSHRRYPVSFTAELRSLVKETIERIEAFRRSFSIPPAEYGAKCKACSLREHCLPSVQRSASGYCMQLRKEAMHEEDVP